MKRAASELALEYRFLYKRPTLRDGKENIHWTLPEMSVIQSLHSSLEPIAMAAVLQPQTSWSFKGSRRIWGRFAVYEYRRTSHSSAVSGVLCFSQSLNVDSLVDDLLLSLLPIS